MIVHLYWHEDSDHAQRSAQRWRDVMPDADVRVALPSTLSFDLSAAIESSCESIDPRDRARHRANCARWWLLSTFGGVWADVDVWPLRGLEERWNLQPWCASLDGVLTPFICGGPAAEPIWERTLVESLHAKAPTSPDASGGRALARVEQGAELMHLPASWFTQHDAAGRYLTGPRAGRYANHAWTTSRRRRSDRSTR